MADMSGFRGGPADVTLAVPRREHRALRLRCGGGSRLPLSHGGRDARPTPSKRVVSPTHGRARSLRGRLLKTAGPALVGVLLIAAAGCERKPGAGGQAAGGRGQAAPAGLAPGSEAWSGDEAVARLDAPETAVSAAIQLVRLEGYPITSLPEPLDAGTVAALKVVSVGEGQWVLGIADVRRPEQLWGPVLLGVDGAVTRFDEDGVDPVVLRISDRPRVYASVIVSRGAVRLLERPAEVAVRLDGPDTVGFALRYRNEYPVVVLVLWADRDQVVAQYPWDPYEEVFMGPAANALPDPPGGRFEINIKESLAFEPVGGEIPPPIVPDDVDERALPDDLPA